MSGSVSVVIPCYGQAHFLGEAIESLHAQTLAPSEIVVVDDGSPDDVAGVVAAYPGVTLRRQTNRGVGAARNAGLEMATGAYVTFVDADDRLLPEALEVAATELDAHPDAALAWGFNRPIDTEGRVIGGISNPWPSSAAGYADLLRRNVVGPPVGVMFRRASLWQAGGFSTGRQAAEDYDAYLRLARIHPIRCHGRLIAEYRYHGENMSSNLVGMLQGVMEVLDLQEPHAAEDPVLRRALREGRRDARRRFDGQRRVEVVRKAVRSSDWRRVVVEGLALLARYPSLFVEALHASALRRLRRGGG